MAYYQPGELFRDQWVIQTGPNGELRYYDHLGGFDSAGYNKVLAGIPAGSTVYIEYNLPVHIKRQYPHIDIKFDSQLMVQNNFLKKYPAEYNPDPKSIINFVCCFNHSYHTGREYLVAKLIENNWFDFDYCTKGFVLDEYPNTTDAYQRIHIVSGNDKNDLESNLQTLAPMIQKSFVQIVSETVSESYIPFVTEKLLFPIANKTLWLAYAQPGWYQQVEQLWGFRKHRCFDYSFDNIQDPVHRLDALIDVLRPFSTMSLEQWQSVYQHEQETIEYNFEWARSKQFIEQLLAHGEKFPRKPGIWYK